VFDRDRGRESIVKSRLAACSNYKEVLKRISICDKERARGFVWKDIKNQTGITSSTYKNCIKIRTMVEGWKLDPDNETVQANACSVHQLQTWWDSIPQANEHQYKL
jgi:hypothetical protein